VVCDDGATGMVSREGLAAKRQSLDGNVVSHVDRLTELKEKEAK
jgi:hypothetical protein